MYLPPPPAYVHPAPDRWGLPVSSRERAITALQAELAAESRMPLQRGAESLLYVHNDRPARGTLIMFHGFTAGTWQFEPLARKAFDDGYDVYVPRLPGHGKMSDLDVEDPSQLLTGVNWRDYVAFGDHAYERVRDLGGPISTLGLSVGGNVAISVAERHPDVAHVVAYAPFLWPRENRVQALMFANHVTDVVTTGRAADALNRLSYSWGPECRRDTLSGDRPGHSHFFAGNVYGATELGWQVVRDASKLQGQLQVFATEVDDAADESALRELFARAGGAPRHGWYRYPAAEGVPHPMVHPHEDKGVGQCPGLYAMTLRFLDTGEPQLRDGGKP